MDKMKLLKMKKPIITIGILLKVIITIVILFIANGTFAQNIEGVWQTFDEDNTPVSEVRVYIENGKLYGKVVKVYDNKYKTITEGPKKYKGQSTVGTMVIMGLEKDGNKWTGKNGVFDPLSGYVANATIWVESKDVLKVMGKVLIFNETQTWKRIK